MKSTDNISVFFMFSSQKPYTNWLRILSIENCSCYTSSIRPNRNRKAFVSLTGNNVDKHKRLFRLSILLFIRYIGILFDKIQKTDC